MKQLCLLLLMCAQAWGAREFRAGTARVDITPTKDIWLSGYAARTKQSEGVIQKLWAKALAFDDGRAKTVIVTTDLIGLPHAVSDVVAARVAKEYNIERSHLLLNSSHTHSGPAVRPNLMTMYFLNDEQRNVIEEYAQKLGDDLVTVIGAAIADLAPARFSVAHGNVDFAINRRAKGAHGNSLPAPIDHDVPVIAVHSPDGKLRAVLFGYACHNTTLGADIYKTAGDYAGYAQAELEAMQPGVNAMFLQLCAGDQNPAPRGTLELAAAHGKTLATEVNRVVAGAAKPLVPDIKTAWQTIDVPFAAHTRETFEKEAKTGNKFEVARAQKMLKAYDEGHPVRRFSYPVQAIRLGKGVVILALGGEVVVDYSLRAKKEFAGTDLIVAGYSNDVMCYIASKRIVREGGYEGNTSMIYYGQPGPLSEDAEEIIFKSIHTVLGRVGVKSSQ